MVKFRRNSHSPRIKHDHETPGPDYYYSKDDYIKPNHEGFQFAKETRFNFDEELDLKEPLNVTLNLVKPRVKMGVIQPLQNNFALEPIVEEDIGPGQYDINENLVKKRSDIGVIKIPEINEHNDRVKNINPLPETFDPLIPLNPNIEAVKPNV